MYHHFGARKTFRLFTVANMFSAILFFTFHLMYIRRRQRRLSQYSLPNEDDMILNFNDRTGDARKNDMHAEEMQDLSHKGVVTCSKCSEVCTEAYIVKLHKETQTDGQKSTAMNGLGSLRNSYIDDLVPTSIVQVNSVDDSTDSLAPTNSQEVNHSEDLKEHTCDRNSLEINNAHKVKNTDCAAEEIPFIEYGEDDSLLGNNTHKKSLTDVSAIKIIPKGSSSKDRKDSSLVDLKSEL